ncbi:MAG: alkene reductase, partial [Gammaproteobacteria bacterium]
EPFQLNRTFTLKNHIFMAPMTRNIANDHLVPTDDMASYYARRADAGLIITEGTIIRADGRGYSNTPGIYTKEQIAGWRKVTEIVHEAGGKIFCQIWHVGRVSHPVFLNGELPIGPSETMMSGPVKRSDGLFYGKNRALSMDEIHKLVDDFATAAQNAREAGFDGVEIHGANGYLIDQFLHHSTNLRNDSYGGSPENMARFAIEIVEACGKKIGFERVALRISPAAHLNEIIDDKRDEIVFITLLEYLNTLPMAYVHTGNFDDSLRFISLSDRTMTGFIRDHYHGVVVACGGYSIESAEKNIENHAFDCIAIGRSFIANPDLIEKLKKNEKLAEYHPEMLKKLY